MLIQTLRVNIWHMPRLDATWDQHRKILPLNTPIGMDCPCRRTSSFQTMTWCRQKGQRHQKEFRLPQLRPLPVLVCFDHAQTMHVSRRGDRRKALRKALLEQVRKTRAAVYLQSCFYCSFLSYFLSISLSSISFMSNSSVCAKWRFTKVSLSPKS